MRVISKRERDMIICKEKFRKDEEEGNEGKSKYTEGEKCKIKEVYFFICKKINFFNYDFINCSLILLVIIM